MSKRLNSLDIAFLSLLATALVVSLFVAVGAAKSVSRDNDLHPQCVCPCALDKGVIEDD